VAKRQRIPRTQKRHLVQEAGGKTVYIMRPEINGIVAFVGGGEGTEIRLSGPITRAAFGDFEITLSSLKQR